MSIKYRQIGNGGAFNYKMTNSSFVIWNKEEYILFDCGYNVYAKLRRLDEDINENFDLKKLKNVYISHLDDDHVGSLKTLIYYQYLNNGIKLNLYCDYKIGEEVTNLIKDLSIDLNNKEKEYLYSLTNLSINTYNTLLIDGIKISTINTNHHIKCFGALFETYSSMLYISGDTKATQYIKETMDSIIDTNKKYKLFHDFSNWNFPEKQVHACFTDTRKIYKDELIKNIQWYHNDSKFDNKWKKL